MWDHWEQVPIKPATALHAGLTGQDSDMKTASLEESPEQKYCYTRRYGALLLAPMEGWWPSATWRALQALWIAV